jgi:hypothetical protein
MEATMLDLVFNIIFIASGIFFLLAVAYAYGFLYYKDYKIIRDYKKIDYKDKK